MANNDEAGCIVSGLFVLAAGLAGAAGFWLNARYGVEDWLLQTVVVLASVAVLTRPVASVLFGLSAAFVVYVLVPLLYAYEWWTKPGWQGFVGEGDSDE